MPALLKTSLPGLPPPKVGKVREVYDLGDELLIVATDRISAFDVVMENGVPDKGRILNLMSAWWFAKLRDVCPNHVISVSDDEIARRAPLPELRGRAMIARKCRPLPIECVARGYISGSLFKEYRVQGSNVHGLDLPTGLAESARLPEPIYTPATKAEAGHDENIDFARTVDLVGREVAEQARDWTMTLYQRAADHASSVGLILADTKFEFGLIDEGLVWIDEALTPDSSRYWPAEAYAPVGAQPSYDKQFVRDYLETIAWDKTPPGPRLPNDVVERTRAKYLGSVRAGYESGLGLSGVFLLYNLLLTLTAPFWVPWMIWRAWRRGEKPNWRERQGDYRESIPKKGDRPRLWLHAVSVGEVVAAQPLLRALRQRLPTHEIVLSVTTSSGHQTAREAEDRLYDHLVYLPIDVARFALSAMQRVRPEALIVMETELWMNLFWAAEAFDVKTFVVNARLSDRSFPRARKLSFFYRALLEKTQKILAQSERDAERFLQLGAPHVEVAGNLKFDQAFEGLGDKTDWREELGLDERPVVVVGSLRVEEFPMVGSFIQPDRSKQWIVAPRHVDRTDELLRSLNHVLENDPIEGFTVGRRSSRTSGDLTVLDSYGELARVYAIADVVVVGGSFKRLGGQNIVQPLAWGKPVLHGPYMANFRDVAALADRAGASITCEDDLGRLIDDLISDPIRRAKMGEAARTLVEVNQGAASRMANAIASSL